jgi:hypothetical protein
MTDTGMPFSAAEIDRLTEMQRLLDEAYTHYFANSDGYCKSSEGDIELTFNNFFQRRDGAPFKITAVGVYSYVLGPSRMHCFKSVDEALATVRDWHAKEMATDYQALYAQEREDWEEYQAAYPDPDELAL